MRVVVDVRASVFPYRGVAISFDPHVEVSLDCAQCRRTRRTVIFDAPDRLGRCTPSGHEFPGRVGPPRTVQKRRVLWREIACSYRLVYDYVPVTDQKYPERASSPVPTWGRLHFKATCPKCGSSSQQALQNNIVLPRTSVCECGHNLYTEKTAFPSFTEVARDDE
jgi:hypothetical protein